MRISMRFSIIVIALFTVVWWSQGSDSLHAEDANKRQIVISEATSSMSQQGIIVMWSGLLIDIPSGWSLCDGTNATPDLRDQFVLGWMDGIDPGEVGGNHDIVLNEGQLPAHDHTGVADAEGLHAHNYFDRYWLAGGDGPAWYGANETPHSGDTQRTSLESGLHSHTFTTDMTGDGDPIDIRPAYYRLAFIMRTSPTGACCLGDQCVELSEADCTLTGGDYIGDGSLCSAIVCPGFGACCLGNTCVPLGAADCFSAGGSFAGVTTECIDVTCPALCTADIVIDGSVNVTDLLALLASWGLCP